MRSPFYGMAMRFRHLAMLMAGLSVFAVHAQDSKQDSVTHPAVVRHHHLLITQIESAATQPSRKSIPAEKDQISYRVQDQRTGLTQVIAPGMPLSGRPLSIVVNDFNFDGKEDIAFLHTDDGMGVYTSYEIYLFNPLRKKFVRMDIPPMSNASCDGGFSDVTLDNKHRRLISQCRGGANWWQDTWYFPHGQPRLLKTRALH